MLELFCSHCGDLLEIDTAYSIGGSAQIKVIPCGCPDVPCDLKSCEHIKDLQEKMKKKDEIIENVKKATKEEE